MPELDSITVKGFKSLASIESLPLRARKLRRRSKLESPSKRT